MVAKVGDIVRHKVGLCKVTRISKYHNSKGKTITLVSLEEMGKDRLGRLRGLGEDGKFGSTGASLRLPIYRRK